MSNFIQVNFMVHRREKITTKLLNSLRKQSILFTKLFYVTKQLTKYKLMHEPFPGREGLVSREINRPLIELIAHIYNIVWLQFLQQMKKGTHLKKCSFSNMKGCIIIAHYVSGKKVLNLSQIKHSWRICCLKVKQKTKFSIYGY